MSDEVVLETHVAPLLLRNGSPVEGKPTNGSKPIAWLDALLCGGLRQPQKFAEDKGRPLVCLICGPPGAGKSLFVQQICYERARWAVRELDGSESWPRMVIISTEAPSGAIAENMLSLGWEDKVNGAEEMLYYWNTDYLPNIIRPLDKPNVKTPSLFPPLTVLSPIGDIGQVNYDVFMDSICSGWNKIGSPTHPDLLVIDSLNVLIEHMERTRLRSQVTDQAGHRMEQETEYESESISVLYKRLINGLDQPPAFLFLVLDGPGIGLSSSATRHRNWEYLADVIIKLDYDYGDAGYFARSVEIVKTRFQSHVLGKQLLKIFPDDQHGASNNSKDNILNLDTDPEGARPNLERGGIFVFPSEHYVLSQIRSGAPLISVNPTRPTLKWAKVTTQDKPAAYGPGDIAPLAGSERTDSDSSASTKAMNWPIPWCYELVGGNGVPLNQTTAIIGRRGLHKSYFCYQFILDGISNEEKTLIVSFRDNPSAVLSTLLRVATAGQYGKKIGKKQIEKWNTVLYQRPGYVTAQEFLHRVITAIAEHEPTRVIINAVDQWEAAYPLLAKSRLLVPTLIDFLNSHQATTLIVGVETQGSLGVTGLTSKAEVVLLFEYRNLEWTRVIDASYNLRLSQGYAIDGFPTGCELRKPCTEKQGLHEPKQGLHEPKVVVFAMRVPHGSAGLARAVLEYELADGSKPAGLRLVPLAPEYPIGPIL